jgi:hypothetical protein
MLDRVKVSARVRNARLDTSEAGVEKRVCVTKSDHSLLPGGVAWVANLETQEARGGELATLPAFTPGFIVRRARFRGVALLPSLYTTPRNSLTCRGFAPNIIARGSDLFH